ncbi:hypothetical protein Psed_0863 [Pseudonocardia dioxanivorans CB1190]|uniref:Uncharacterized protein n=1 Tax=Pseudonocardia dioxanivorans (strain ATCC 55486 / DSM 44775 / JCM 13855 / CB1190) TaxID=675635 RepID=F4CSE3_PSEUX|nr:hypothetical protein [Pseudonocardia dioxanivorans]AEA23117.1 hypothetical protein Psed_0863 [Pseudonocardia dioxanivorans CB1190]
MAISRDVVEHEAAHYVAARAFGVRVERVEVVGDAPGKAGSCAYRAGDWFPNGSWGGLWLERCAAALAPQIWLKELAPKRLRPRGVEADNALVDRVLRETLPPDADPFHRRQLRRRAEDRAQEVLSGRRDEVLAFADGLARHGIWTARDGFGGPRVGHIRRAVRPAGCSLDRPETGRSAARRPAPRPVLSREEEHQRAVMESLRTLVARGLVSSFDAEAACRRAGFRTEFRYGRTA